MAALLALASAATWGVGDFLGGLSAKRTHELSVTALSQLAGLVVLALVLPLAGVAPQRDALLAGAIAGVGGAGGLLLYFRALAIGPMGVTGPLSAVTGAAVPVAYGLLRGERPAALALVGIVLAVVATAVIARPAPTVAPHDVGGGPATASRTGIVTALLSGTLFGVFFIALDAAPDDGGLWPLLAGRGTGLVLLAIALAAVRPPRPAGRETRLSVASGLMDMVANVLFLLATQTGGLLSLTSVLASLYPVGVLLLARAVLHERLSRTQWAGVVLAVTASLLIAR